MKNELTKKKSVWDEAADAIECDAATTVFGFKVFRSGMIQLGATLLRFSERQEVRVEVDELNKKMGKGRRWTTAGYTAHKIHETLSARGAQILSKKHLHDCINVVTRAKESGSLNTALNDAQSVLSDCKKVVDGRALLGWSKRNQSASLEGVNVERVIAPSVREEKSESGFSVEEYGDEIIAALETSIKKLDGLLSKKPLNTPLLKCLNAKQTDRYRDIIHAGRAVFENFNLVFGERQRTNGKN